MAFWIATDTPLQKLQQPQATRALESNQKQVSKMKEGL